MRHLMSRAIVPAALCGVGLIGLALDSFVSTPPESNVSDDATGVIFVDTPVDGAVEMKSIPSPQIASDSPVTISPELLDAILDLPVGMPVQELVDVPPVDFRHTQKPPRVPGMRSHRDAQNPSIAPALSLSLDPSARNGIQGDLDAIVASIESALSSHTTPAGEPDWVTATVQGWRTLDESHGDGGSRADVGRDNWRPVDAIPATTEAAEPAPAVLDFDAVDEHVVALRSRARALLVAARGDLQAGRVNAARLKALQAESLEAPYTVLDDRPDLVLNAIARVVEEGTGREVPTPQLADWAPPAQLSQDVQSHEAAGRDDAVNPFLFETQMELEPVARPEPDGETEAPGMFQPFEDGEPDLLDAAADSEPATGKPGTTQPQPAHGGASTLNEAVATKSGIRGWTSDAAERPDAEAGATGSGWNPLDPPAVATGEKVPEPEKLTAHDHQWMSANLIAQEIEAAVAARTAAARAETTQHDDQPTEFERFVAENSRPRPSNNAAGLESRQGASGEQVASDELVALPADESVSDGELTTPAEAPLFGSLVEGVAQESQAAATDRENPFLLDHTQASTADSRDARRSASETEHDDPVSENPFLSDSTDEGELIAESSGGGRVEHAAAAGGNAEPTITATGLSHDAERRWPVLELNQVRRDPRGEESATIVSIAVRNVSSATAHGVVVESGVPPEWTVTGVVPQCRVQAQRLSWEIGTLQPGEERLVWLRVHEQRTVAAHPLTLVRYSANPAIDAFHDVEIDVAGARTVHVGQSLAVRFRLQNHGSADLANILIRDILPAQVDHPGGSDLSNEIPQLPAGREAEMELQLTAVEPGRAPNQITLITGDGQYVTGCMDLVVLPAYE